MIIGDERVTALHMTGSITTYNAIVWGPEGPSSGRRLVTKPFEAELGCVTPYIIVPSTQKWSQHELTYQAMSAVASIVLNSGHNCNATEVIVTAKGWKQRDAFLAAVRHYLGTSYQRWTWYPGSQVCIGLMHFCSLSIRHMPVFGWNLKTAIQEVLPSSMHGGACAFMLAPLARHGVETSIGHGSDALLHHRL
jgi:hypothetical protein